MADEPVVLELRKIGKQYASAEGAPPVEILSEVDLLLHAGEAVAIIGPSGSGKSTLLNIMGSLDRPTAGEVLLHNRNIAALSDNEVAEIRNREFGFIFQSHHLLPQCSVLENVLVPSLVLKDTELKAGAHARAHELLKRVGLAHRLEHRPGQLSGGERQRVAVVRALINRPRILLADEPTGALDVHSSENLIALLRELNRELRLTMVLVTHALDLAAQMTTTYRLLDRRLQALPRHT